MAMAIIVCPLSHVADMIQAHAPERIVSLLDPEFAFPDAGPDYSNRHLRLHFHDIHVAMDNHVLPSVEHVGALLAFIGGWLRTAPLLIHCRAGIGRSTAAAYITACASSPDNNEYDIAVQLRQVAPLARPNETLIRLADRALGRDGRMSTAMTETGLNLPELEVYEGEPFMLLPLM